MKQLVVHVLRGSTVESEHAIDAVVMDSKGKIVSAYGDSQRLTFPRSAIKMSQALVFVESGALQKFDLNEEHIALACASHWAEPRHVELARQWLKKISLDESVFACGPHYPADEKAVQAMIKRDEKPTAVHNNCSGKHLGLISATLAHGQNPRGYADYHHFIQQKLRQVLSQISGYSFEQAQWGIDGCGIPTYAVPLQVIARLIADAMSRERIIAAIQKNPTLISGTEGLCTKMIQVTKGRVIAKTGAEGVYTALDLRQNLVFALKVKDGQTRASQAAILKLLQVQGALSEEEYTRILPPQGNKILNWAGTEVGEIRVLEP
jgi:L-asparaginase II